MTRSECKIGTWVSFKQDYEVSGKIISKVDSCGYVMVQGPDEETSDGVYNVHISDLEKDE